MKDAKRYSNDKLMREYQNTYYRYMQTCERYDQLVRAYTTLLHSEKEASPGEDPAVASVYMSQREKNLRYMIKKTYIEKNTIAQHARECLNNLRKQKAVNIHFMVDSETADQWA